MKSDAPLSVAVDTDGDTRLRGWRDLLDERINKVAALARSGWLPDVNLTVRFTDNVSPDLAGCGRAAWQTKPSCMYADEHSGVVHAKIIHSRSYEFVSDNHFSAIIRRHSAAALHGEQHFRTAEITPTCVHHQSSHCDLLVTG